jgi:hypothetical protein
MSNPQKGQSKTGHSACRPEEGLAFKLRKIKLFEKPRDFFPSFFKVLPEQK